LARYGLIRASIIFTLLLACLAPPLLAAEPVQLAVEGVEDAPLDNVREALALPSGLVRDGKVDRLWLERFVRQADKRALTALEPFGYYNAKASVSLETVAKDEYRVRVRIEPGAPVRITSLKLALKGAGDREEKLLQMIAAFPLHQGDQLLQQAYEKAKGALAAKAQELGYLDAVFTVHEIRITRSASAAQIDLKLDTGPLYRFGEVTIEGAPDYERPLLHRYLAFKPGDVFSNAKLGETQLNFTNSERFKEVMLTPRKQEARDFQVPVLIQLKQGPRRTLRPGIGYGTDTGARVSLRYRDFDTFHLGHEYNANLYISERLQGLATGYTILSARDIRSSTGVLLTLQREDVTTYLSRLASVELDRNRSFGPERLGTLYLKVQQEDFTIGSENSSARLVLPGLRFSETRFDSLVRPTSGYRYAFDLRGTHQVLGSDTGLLQLVAEAGAFVPLPWRLDLHLRARAGATLLSDPLHDIPPSLRFFAGGDRSVRGYAYQSLGPRDANGLVIGGKHLLTGSIELERALFAKWGVSAFYDVGNAFDSFTDVRFYQGAGVGVHYYTPVGALNLYLARQVWVDNPAWRVDFNVGFEL
jgi:translocation and assembly module TamA